MNVEARLAELGLVLPEAPRPVAVYVPAVRSGNLLFVSGQLPLKDGKMLATGPVPSQVSLEDAHAAAKQCAINALAVLKAAIGGDWSKLAGAVRVGAFVQSDDGYGDQPQVANGASELLEQILGEAGRHARAAVGTNSLPRNATVEVEFVFELRP